MSVLIDTELSSAVTSEAIERGERGLETERGQAALSAARVVAGRGFSFTTDDVWVELGWVPPSHNEASFMGSIMRHLSVNSEIERTGRVVKSARPKQHRKELTEWRRKSAVSVNGSATIAT